MSDLARFKQRYDSKSENINNLGRCQHGVDVYIHLPGVVNKNFAISCSHGTRHNWNQIRLHRDFNDLHFKRELFAELQSFAVALPSIPPANGSCPFNELPNELRDSIFGLVYLTDGPVRPLNKTRWEVKEKSRREKEGKKFVPAAFGTPYVDRFMVSRVWFVGALTHFYKNTTFDFENLFYLYSLLRRSSSAYTLQISPTDNNGIRLHKVPLHTILRSVSADAETVLKRCDRWVIEHCQPALRNVKLRFDDEYFMEAEKEIDKVLWTSKDFEEFEPTMDLLKLRGLPNIVAESMPPRWYEPEQSAMFKWNIELLQSLLNDAAARPRLEQPVNNECPFFFKK